MAISKIADKNAKRYTLYQQGLTDREIAEAEGITRQTVRGWRRRAGLPFNYRVLNVLNMPKWERLIIRDFVADMIYLCDKVGRTPDADGISNAMAIWREKRGIA